MTRLIPFPIWTKHNDMVWIMIEGELCEGVHHTKQSTMLFIS